MPKARIKINKLGRPYYTATGRMLTASQVKQERKAGNLGNMPTAPASAAPRPKAPASMGNASAAAPRRAPQPAPAALAAPMTLDAGDLGRDLVAMMMRPRDPKTGQWIGKGGPQKEVRLSKRNAEQLCADVNARRGPFQVLRLPKNTRLALLNDASPMAMTLGSTHPVTLAAPPALSLGSVDGLTPTASMLQSGLTVFAGGALGAAAAQGFRKMLAKFAPGLANSKIVQWIMRGTQVVAAVLATGYGIQKGSLFLAGFGIGLGAEAVTVTVAEVYAMITGQPPNASLLGADNALELSGDEEAPDAVDFLQSLRDIPADDNDDAPGRTPAPVAVLPDDSPHGQWRHPVALSDESVMVLQ